MKLYVLRNVQTIISTFWLPLLAPRFAKNTRRSFGYASVFCLARHQNSLPINVDHIIRMFLISMIFYVHALPAQETGRLYDLNEILELAAANSLELQQVNSFLKENQLQINLLSERLKPQVVIDATLPDLSRSIESRPLPDGRDAFVNRSTMYNGAAVRMNYQLAGTGGTIFARSALDRLDILKTNQLDYSRNYFFTPIAFGINQPLFQFNEVKWQKQRNSLLHAELSAQQFFVREEVLQNALSKYATAFLAQLQRNLARQKLVETDTLFQIKERLFAIGKATKVEMLRLELERENNTQMLERAELDWEAAQKELCDYLQLNENSISSLLPPPELSDNEIDEEKAKALALQNEYLAARNQRRLKEAETQIEIAKKDRGIVFDLNLSLGLNKSSTDLDRIFSGLQDRQNISLGILVPITDGKSRELKREIAEEQYFREQIEIQREFIDLIRQVSIDVKTYRLLVKNIDLNRKAMETTQEIFELTSSQYLLGNQNITELNYARSERDQALFGYYQSILEATLKYFEIRKNCLYDFREDSSLVR